MAKENKLKDAAVRVGSAVGRVDGRVHKAAHVAMQELDELTKQVDALKKQLAISSKRLQDALK